MTSAPQQPALPPTPRDNPVAHAVWNRDTNVGTLQGLVRMFGLINPDLTVPAAGMAHQRCGLLPHFLRNATTRDTTVLLPPWTQPAPDVGGAIASHVAWELVRAGCDPLETGSLTSSVATPYGLREHTSQWDMADLAAQEGHWAFVHALLADTGPLAHTRAHINSRIIPASGGQPEQSWLHACVKSRHESMTNMLLAWGCDPNVRDTLGQTPLFLARTPTMISLLLDAGGDAYATNAKGQVALEVWRAAADVPADICKKLERAVITHKSVQGTVLTVQPNSAIRRDWPQLWLTWFQQLPTSNKSALAPAARQAGVPLDVMVPVGDTGVRLAPPTWLVANVAVKNSTKTTDKTWTWVTETFTGAGPVLPGGPHDIDLRVAALIMETQRRQNLRHNHDVWSSDIPKLLAQVQARDEAVQHDHAGARLLVRLIKAHQCLAQIFPHHAPSFIGAIAVPVLTCIVDDLAPEQTQRGGGSADRLQTQWPEGSTFKDSVRIVAQQHPEMLRALVLGMGETLIGQHVQLLTKAAPFLVQDPLVCLYVVCAKAIRGGTHASATWLTDKSLDASRSIMMDAVFTNPQCARACPDAVWEHFKKDATEMMKAIDQSSDLIKMPPIARQQLQQLASWVLHNDISRHLSMDSSPQEPTTPNRRM